MYEWNECFPQPHDLDAKVWRYMDLPKLISLLHTSKLFFSRVDKLGDPFEGSSPQGLINARKKLLTQIKQDPQYSHMPEKREEILHSYDTVPETLATMSKFMAVNCWHMNDDESMAMWKLYLSSSDGIAIQTTYSRLQQSFQHAEEAVNMGMVNYIDYDNESFSAMNIDYLFMHKRKCFKHEHEVRCLVRRWPEHWRDAPLIEEGVSIPVILNVLIENIYVAPTSPDWFLDVVNTVICKFGQGQIAIKSSLAARPKH